MSNYKFDIISFLEVYQKFPCLWYKSSKDFKSREKRNAAEKEILMITKIPSLKELRRKIRIIR